MRPDLDRINGSDMVWMTLGEISPSGEHAIAYSGVQNPYEDFNIRVQLLKSILRPSMISRYQNTE